MTAYFKYFFRLFAFWILFFFILRIGFVLYQLGFEYTISFKHLIYTFFYGMYMDLSMAAYFMTVPLLLYFLKDFIPLIKVISYYNLILILLVSGIYAADAVLYREWGFRLDKTAFSYLTKFKEAGSFISSLNISFYLILFALYLFIGFFLFKKLKISIPDNKWTYAINLILLPALIIPMRGGLSIIPMNPGKVYFSNIPFPNHVALNVPWNIIYTSLQIKKMRNEIKFMDAASSNKILDSLITRNYNSSDLILKTKRPKIILFILESFTAKLIHASFEDKEITPELNGLFENGIYFKNAYSSGDRTEIGLASILSGFPAQPQSSIVHFPQKTEKLPSLIRSLSKEGYHSSFYYGGDVSFASMSTYLFNCGIDKIIDKSSFLPETYNAKWGVHDHILFEKFYTDILADSSRFIKICLSLSSHPPYDIPEEVYWKNNNEEVSFLNSAHYTDKYLGKLITKLKKTTLWPELLVLIVADHGCRFPGNDLYHVPEKFHIPIWFGGGAVKVDSVVNQVVSQIDITPGILSQLEISNSDFDFSQNLFCNNHNPFAYFAFNNGFGLVDRLGIQVYSNDKNQIILTEGSPSLDIRNGKAFLQKVWDRFHAL